MEMTQKEKIYMAVWVQKPEGPIQLTLKSGKKYLGQFMKSIAILLWPLLGQWYSFHSLWKLSSFSQTPWGYGLCYVTSKGRHST